MEFNTLIIIVLTFSSVPQKAEASAANCPLGWFHDEFSCFFFSSDVLSWYDAESSCRAHNARLAEVYSSHVLGFLRITAKSYGYDYWLGSRDDIIEGEWKWASTGLGFSVTDWAPGEPNNDHEQDCLHIYAEKDYHWDDTACSVKMRFICESK